MQQFCKLGVPKSATQAGLARQSRRRPVKDRPHRESRRNGREGTLAINPPAPPPASNSFLITPGAGTFKDAAGNTYGVDSSDNANENGQPIPGGGGTSAMAYFNGIVYGQDAGSGQWYTWNQTAWTPAASSMSDVTTAGTLTKNLLCFLAVWRG